MCIKILKYMGTFFFLYAFCLDLDKITYSNNESLFILIIIVYLKLLLK